MYFLYRQSNSGGFFSGPVFYVVEASDYDDANRKAEGAGTVYFSGIAAGRDCGCCGDRWYRVGSWDVGFSSFEDLIAFLRIKKVNWLDILGDFSVTLLENGVETDVTSRVTEDQKT